MSHEKWLVTILLLIVTVILSLVSALAWSYGHDLHAIASIIFLLTFPLLWLAWIAYHFWCNLIRELTTYTQMLKDGQHNLSFKEQHPDNLLLETQNEISALAIEIQQKNTQNRTVENMLGQILESWSVPVCLFDSQLKLTYRNSAMNEQIQQPMLLGSTAEELGFSQNKGTFIHSKFDQKWQCQTISYLQQNPNSDLNKNENEACDNRHWLFSALDISQLLNKNQSITQKNIIRVLGHEIRNSLTPMYSMTDTLLSKENLDEQQTRLVLSRIHQRSKRLLTFIENYSQLAQLPRPKLVWFDFNELLAEARGMFDEKVCVIEFQGSERCFGDSLQITQVMINLIKNTQEACDHPIIKIKSYYQQEHQIIEINDNGPGFANLDNVLTPFYTTKKDGSGIGLSICSEIIRNHGGQLKVTNITNEGAQIRMSWPIIHAVTNQSG